MNEIDVITDPEAVRVALDPVRMTLLAELTQPGSATTLSKTLGIPRQKINYHLRALEEHGLIELVEERRKRGTIERIMRASASYVISPQVLDLIQPDPDQSADRLSIGWLLALAAQLTRDVADLFVGSRRAGRKVSTFALDGEVRFASAAARTEFAQELTKAVTALAARYHDDDAPAGRPHRLVIAIHPSVRTSKHRQADRTPAELE